MVEVSQTVLDQLKAIRRGGKHNMLDYDGVMAEAFANEYHELVVWMHENKKDYARGVFEGFITSRS